MRLQEVQIRARSVVSGGSCTTPAAECGRPVKVKNPHGIGSDGHVTIRNLPVQRPDRRRLPDGRRRCTGSDIDGIVKQALTGAEVNRRSARQTGRERVRHENGAGVIAGEHGTALDDDPAFPFRRRVLRFRVDAGGGAYGVEGAVIDARSFRL